MGKYLYRATHRRAMEFIVQQWAVNNPFTKKRRLPLYITVIKN